jgi:hypothetical protein
MVRIAIYFLVGAIAFYVGVLLWNYINVWISIAYWIAITFVILKIIDNKIKDMFNDTNN